MNLSTGDRALIGVLCGIGLFLGAVYWLLCMVWAYQKADRLGSNKGLWTAAAMFFNLWAIMALYGYSLVRGTCTSCGSCRFSIPDGAKFCPNCGEAMKTDSSDNEQE